jgi:hypothetical protein
MITEEAREGQETYRHRQILTTQTVIIAPHSPGMKKLGRKADRLGMEEVKEKNSL